MKCTKCNEEKPVGEFYKDKARSNGLTSACRSCHKEVRDENRERNRLYMQDLRRSNGDTINEKKRESWQLMDARKKLLIQARARAKRKNIEFSLSLEDIVIPDKCPLLEIDFVVGTKNDYEFTHSLDRIDSTKGYTKNNIWVITKLANSMKNSASRQELLTFSKNIFKYFKDDDIV